eukprot:4346213-Prymnesium_polylepis.1
MPPPPNVISPTSAIWGPRTPEVSPRAYSVANVRELAVVAAAATALLVELSGHIVLAAGGGNLLSFPLTSLERVRRST